MFKATKATKAMLAAVTLLVAASAPSAASARPDLNPSPPAVAIVVGQSQGASPVVRSNPDQQAPQTTSPSTGRRVRVAGVPRCPRIGPCISPYGSVTHGSRGDAVHQTVATTQEPFQWGDAGIGAGGMLLLLSAGGAATIASRRQRHRVTAS